MKVELPGYGAQFDAPISDQVDVIHAFTNSPGYVKVAASPSGLRLLPVPHDDEEGWARRRDISPFYFKSLAKDGPNLPPQGLQTATSPDPILVAMAERPEEDAYNMTKAMVVLHEAYKDSAPGMSGWAVERQRLAETLVPFHAGAVRYFKEIGVWTPEAQAAQERNQRRQQILQKEWEAYVAKAPDDTAAFRQGWMKARAAALEAAGMPVIQDDWDFGS